MSIRAMRDNEVIMYQEQGLQLIGLIAVYVEFILTTDRLIVQPLYWLEKTLLGAKDLSFELEDINTIEVKGFNQVLEIESFGFKYSFIGKGAKRIRKQIEKKMHCEKVTEERVFFHGKTNISISSGLSLPGKISIFKDGIQIKKLKQLETQLFPDIDFSSRWSELERAEFSELNRMLKMATRNKSIKIFGAAAKLAFYLKQLSDTQEYVHETISMFRMYQGSFLSVQGYLFIGNKSTHFLPITQLEDLLGQPILSEPNQELWKVSVRGIKKSILTLHFKNKVWNFEHPNPLLWGQYYQLSIFSLYKKSPMVDPPIPHKVYEVVFQCYATYKEYNSNNTLYFGQRVLTREHLLFYPQYQRVSFQVKLSEIQQVEQKGIKLLLLAQKKTVEFQLANTEKLTEYTRRIINCLPPIEIREARGNQPTDKILGENENILLLRFGTPFLEANKSNVHENSKRIQLFLPKQKQPIFFTPGESLEIDLAKPQGRYRFKTILLEEYINQPDPVGRHYLTIEIPDNIYIYNKRKSFRVPIAQETTLKPLKENDTVDNIQGEIINLSDLGCRILTKTNVNPEELLNETKYQFTIFLSENPHLVTGQLLNAQEQENGVIIIGLQFVDLPLPTNEAIQREVLIVERELLRQNAESL